MTDDQQVAASSYKSKWEYPMHTPSATPIKSMRPQPSYGPVNKCLRRLPLLILAGTLAALLLSCDTAEPPRSEPRDRDESQPVADNPDVSSRSGFFDRISTKTSGFADARDSDGVRNLSDTQSDAITDRFYTPEMIGTKVFVAENAAEVKAYFPGGGGSGLRPEEVFGQFQQSFDRLPDDGRVFRPDTPVIVTAVLFDCSPVGNISINGSVRLVYDSAPNAPFTMYERPVSILREQGDAPNVFNISGTGCLDNLNVNTPTGIWDAGNYRVEYLDGEGKVFATLGFEIVAEPAASQRAVPQPMDSGRSRSEQRPLFIDINTGGSWPWAVAVKSPFIIEPGELIISATLDGRIALFMHLQNTDRIMAGEDFAPVGYRIDQAPPGDGWLYADITDVFASTDEGDLECELDQTLSDQRRQHAFDGRQVYECTYVEEASGQSDHGAERPSGQEDTFAGSFMDWCITGASVDYCNCLLQRVFLELATREIIIIGSETVHPGQRHQALLESMRATYGNDFEGMLTSLMLAYRVSDISACD